MKNPLRSGLGANAFIISSLARVFVTRTSLAVNDSIKRSRSNGHPLSDKRQHRMCFGPDKPSVPIA